MTVNVLIFIKFLKNHYAVEAGPEIDDTIMIQGIRHFTKYTKLKGFAIIADGADIPAGAAKAFSQPEESQKQTPLEPSGVLKYLRENLFITGSRDIFCAYKDKLPVLLIKNVPGGHGSLENAVLGVWDHLVSWTQSLSEICLTQKSYQKLLDACDTIAAEPMALINNHFCYVAYSRQLSRQRGYVRQFVTDANTVSMDITTQLIANPEYSRLAQKHGVFEFMDDYHFIACNIFSEASMVGRLISICTENTFTDRYQRQVIAFLAPYIEKMYHQNGTFFLEEPVLTQLHSLLSKSVQSQKITENDWAPLLPGLGWKTDDRYQIMDIRPTFRYEKNLFPDYLCPQIEHRWPFSLAVVIDGALIVLVNNSRAYPQYTQELAYFLRDNLMCAGVSRSFTGPGGIFAACRQSVQALTFGLQKNPHFWYHSFDDYAFDHIMEHARSDYEPEQICHPALLILRRHDQEHGSAFYETLHTWFKKRFNSVAAAKALYIHRTTFIKRMEHIREITGIDLDDWDTIVYLTLSFKLLS